MSIPVGMPNCPQGLEYLTALDQLLVSQKIEKLELITGFESKNRFKVKNSLGQNVYFAYEESDCCTRNMLGRSRPFEMKILDNFQNEVLHLYRPFKCDVLCCFPSCMNAVEVSAPPGQVIGSVEQVCTFMRPKFNIKNTFGDIVLQIEGPICPIKCFSDTNFKVSRRPTSGYSCVSILIPIFKQVYTHTAAVSRIALNAREHRWLISLIEHFITFLNDQSQAFIVIQLLVALIHLIAF